MTERSTHSAVAEVIGAVVAGAVQEAGAGGIIVLDDGSPEVTLALECCGVGLGKRRVLAPSSSTAEAVGSLVRSALGEDVGEFGPDSFHAEQEAKRFAARLMAAACGWLLAHPANKTALLLSRTAPPEQILPLGDLYASEVEAILGRCSVPAEAERLVELAGGVAALDRLLYALVDERREAEAVLAGLPCDLARKVLNALAASRFARRRLGLVPKLGRRTLGIDFFA